METVENGDDKRKEVEGKGGWGGQSSSAGGQWGSTPSSSSGAGGWGENKGGGGWSTPAPANNPPPSTTRAKWSAPPAAKVDIHPVESTKRNWNEDGEISEEKRRRIRQNADADKSQWSRDKDRSPRRGDRNSKSSSFAGSGAYDAARPGESKDYPSRRDSSETNRGTAYGSDRHTSRNGRNEDDPRPRSRSPRTDRSGRGWSPKGDSRARDSHHGDGSRREEKSSWSGASKDYRSDRKEENSWSGASKDYRGDRYADLPRSTDRERSRDRGDRGDRYDGGRDGGSSERPDRDRDRHSRRSGADRSRDRSPERYTDDRYASLGDRRSSRPAESSYSSLGNRKADEQPRYASYAAKTDYADAEKYDGSGSRRDDGYRRRSRSRSAEGRRQRHQTRDAYGRDGNRESSRDKEDWRHVSKKKDSYTSSATQSSRNPPSPKRDKYAPPVRQSQPVVARGRGKGRTLPAWMTKNEEDANFAAPAAAPAAAAPSSWSAPSQPPSTSWSAPSQPAPTGWSAPSQPTGWSAPSQSTPSSWSAPSQSLPSRQSPPSRKKERNPRNRGDKGKSNFSGAYAPAGRSAFPAASPSAAPMGRGRGRGRDSTLPAWMTKKLSQENGPR